MKNILIFLTSIWFLTSCASSYQITKRDLVSQLKSHNYKIKNNSNTNSLKSIVCVDKDSSIVKLGDGKIYLRIFDKNSRKKIKYPLSSLSLSLNEDTLKGYKKGGVSSSLHQVNLNDFDIVDIQTKSPYPWKNYIKKSKYRLKEEYRRYRRDSLVNYRTINYVGIVPYQFKTLNGWAVGVLPLDMKYTDHKKTINGLYTNISPFQVIFGLMIPIVIMEKISKPEHYIKVDRKNLHIIRGVDSTYNKLNGVSISIFNVTDSYIKNGLQISVVHKMYKLTGVSISALSAEYNQFNGVMISGIFNEAVKGRGVQIGLINKCDDFYGVQFGLWNKIGKFGFPFVNMRFKRKR